MKPIFINEWFVLLAKEALVLPASLTPALVSDN